MRSRPACASLKSPNSTQAAPADASAEGRAALERFAAANRRDAGEDHDGALVAFFTSDWRRNRAEEEWPMLRFHAVREQHGLEEVRR